MQHKLALVWALAVAVLLLVGEGVHALLMGHERHTSLIFQAIERVAPQDPLRRIATPEPLLSDPREIEALLPLLRENAVGMGNAPYAELITEAAAVNADADGCLAMRPDLDKSLTFLRTALFERLNPLTMFWNTHRPLPGELSAFLDRYAVRRVRLTTNGRGERTTLPERATGPVTLVAGDSVALGAMVGDGETLASALQARDPARRYVNIGVGGADAWDIRCALERAERDHAGALDALVYVYCENDLDPEERMGTPDQVVGFLREFAARNGLRQVIVVYAPYVYNIVPELTRVRGERGGRFPDHAAEKAVLARLVTDAGFAWIDMGDLALDAARRAGTRFAALALFADLVHLSPAGTALLGTAVEQRLAR